MIPIPAPTPSSVLEVECINPSCSSQGKGLKLRKELSQPQLLNSPTVSVVVYPHEIGLTCPRCDTYYQLALVGFQAQMNWGIQPVQRPGGLMVVPAGGLPKVQ